MSATLWSIIGGFVAIGAEFMYRTSPPGETWFSRAWLWIPLSALVSLCVFHIVRAPGASLLSAFIVWTCTTIIVRTFVCIFILHDPVSKGTWLAIALLVAARIAQQVWK